MRCPVCYKDNPPEAEFCEFCRLPLPDPSTRFQKTDLVSGAAVSDAEFAKGSLIANRYLVMRELGRGGMGVVYLVKDQQLHDKEVALKLISTELTANEHARERFVQEVLAAQQLSHPNVVKVFHLDQWNGQSFFTMEYVPGRSLRVIIEARKHEGRLLSLEETKAILIPVLDALHHAHTQPFPVIHRDIKPDNIIVAGKFPSPQVKVLDFGLAKMCSASKLTATAVSMGTAYYMAPEQVQGGQDIDPRADLFSAGVVFYEMLTGSIPTGFFSMPSEISEGLSPSVDEVIKRTLQQNPGKRFSSAVEFENALCALSPNIGEKSKINYHEIRGSELNKQQFVEDGVNLRAEVDARRLIDEEVRLRQFAEEELSRHKVVTRSNRNKVIFTAFGLALMALLFVWQGIQRHPVSSLHTVSTVPIIDPSASQYSLTIHPEPDDADINFVDSNRTYRPGIRLDPGRYDLQIQHKGYVAKNFEALITDHDLVAEVLLDKESVVRESLAVSEYSLTIRTNPADAEVMFTDSGLRYQHGMKLLPGDYEIEVRKDGYQSKRQQMRIIDRDMVVEVGLEPLYSLTVRPTPADAQIKILNIKPRYHAGIMLQAGQYEVEVSRPGYKTALNNVNIINKNVSYSVNLEKKLNETKNYNSIEQKISMESKKNNKSSYDYNLSIDVWAEKSAYNIGDYLKFYFKGNKSFYARALYIDNDNNVVEITPYNEDRYYAGGVVYEIPSDSDSFKLKITPPVGREKLVLYASTQKLRKFEGRAGGGVKFITDSKIFDEIKVRGLAVLKAENQSTVLNNDVVEKIINIDVE